MNIKLHKTDSYIHWSTRVGHEEGKEEAEAGKIPGELLGNKHQFSKNSKEGTSKYFYSLCHLLSASSHTIPCSECAHFEWHQIAVYGLGRKDWQPCITTRLSFALLQIGGTYTVSPPIVKAAGFTFYINVSSQIVWLHRKDFSIASIASILSITILKQITTTQNGENLIWDHKPSTTNNPHVPKVRWFIFSNIFSKIIQQKCRTIAKQLNFVNLF